MGEGFIPPRGTQSPFLLRHPICAEANYYWNGNWTQQLGPRIQRWRGSFRSSLGASGQGPSDAPKKSRCARFAGFVMAAPWEARSGVWCVAPIQREPSGGNCPNGRLLVPRLVAARSSLTLLTSEYCHPPRCLPRLRTVLSRPGTCGGPTREFNAAQARFAICFRAVPRRPDELAVARGQQSPAGSGHRALFVLGLRESRRPAAAVGVRAPGSVRRC